MVKPLDMPDLQEVLQARRTIHSFRPDPVPPDVLREGIESARWAPNHRHTEPWKFYVLGPQTAQKIVALNTELVLAAKGQEAAAKKRERWSKMPGWLAVTSDRSPDPQIDLENYAACCCAVQNLSLYLWNQGIGMKWGTGAVTRERRLYTLIKADSARVQIMGLFWYGYPEAVPEMRRKKSVSEITFELP